jgi:hypothetical protein
MLFCHEMPFFWNMISFAAKRMRAKLHPPKDLLKLESTLHKNVRELYLKEEHTVSSLVLQRRSGRELDKSSFFMVQETSKLGRSIN